MVDLRPDHLELVKHILARHVPEYEVRAFGSRVRWTAKETSDLDLVVMTDAPLDLARLADLQEAFSESDLPFRVDVLDWAAIAEDFRRIIEQEYVVIQPGSTSSSGPTWRALGMADEWRTVEFSDVLIDGTRNGIYKKKEFHGSGVKIVNMGELFAYPRLYAIPMKRVELTEAELERSSLECGDLLFARRSLVAEGAGKCSIVMEVNEPTTFESSIIRARPNRARANSLFLYYFFNSPQGRYLLSTIARQVAVAGITGSDLVRLRVPQPPLKTQEAIARILGTLDDKIELNRHMNETLEAMARAIFKSWFVDFDPVRAKAAGQQPSGLAPHIADLFPDEFVESSLGLIPAGWRVDSILTVGELLSGGTPSTKVPEYWNGDIKWVSARDVSGAHGTFLLDTERTITQEGVENSSTKILPELTTIVTARGTVGSYCILAEPMAMNQTNYGLKAISENTDYFVFFALGSLVSQLKQRAYGTIFDTVTTRTFETSQIVVPPVFAISEFDQQAQPVMEMIRHSLRQSRTLAALRDTLLPRLISGELRVRDAEKFVEAAV